MTSLLGSGRRCHLARAAAALAASLDFLQGSAEKTHIQGLLCQKLLQAMDFLAVSRCVRAGPRRFLSWLNHLQLPAPLVEAPRSYPEFSRQLTDIFASLHPCDGHSLKFPGVSLSLHCGFLSRKLCPILCATSRVQSSRSPMPAHQVHKDRRALDRQGPAVDRNPGAQALHEGSAGK